MTPRASHAAVLLLAALSALTLLGCPPNPGKSASDAGVVGAGGRTP